MTTGRARVRRGSPTGPRWLVHIRNADSQDRISRPIPTGTSTPETLNLRHSAHVERRVLVEEHAFDSTVCAPFPSPMSDGFIT